MRQDVNPEDVLCKWVASHGRITLMPAEVIECCVRRSAHTTG